MAGIYIYSDKADIAAELISFARGTGKNVSILAFSQEEAAKVAPYGADRVYLIEGDSEIVESYSKAIAIFLQSEEAELFAVGATARGRDLAARTAGYLDCGMSSDVSSLSYSDGKLFCERMMYGGAVVQNEVLTELSVVTVPAGKYESDVPGNKSEIVTIKLQSDSRVCLVVRAPIMKEGTDLNCADKIVCVGLGLNKEDDMQMVRDLAAALGAEIGCTRGIAEERHWLPAEQYIGISGAVVKPRLYVSMGVSGQVQHVVGVRDAKVIVAIDTNDKAPIFRAADYGIVADMYEVIPLLSEALKKA